MNRLRSHLNESNSKDIMFKKDLKEPKVTTYTNNVHLSFGDSSIGTPKLSVFSLEQS